MDNLTYGVNQLEQKIPIEEWVRNLACHPRTFTISLIDCCRIKKIEGKAGEEKSQESSLLG
jgi:hypothetical protein